MENPKEVIRSEIEEPIVIEDGVYPLIVNRIVNRVQELPFGSNLNLEGNSIININAINGKEIVSTSDLREKENIHRIKNAISMIESLNGVYFTWKQDDKKSMGLIAQDVSSIFPHLVKEDDGGNLSVSYGNIVAILIEAIKEQDKELKDLMKMVSDV